MQVSSKTEDGKDLPLKDLIVYPEIFSNDTNISETSYGYLQKLGAKIEKRINKKCNLIIWKDGSIKTIEKAREYNIPVVNSLWLEDCVENFHLADLKKYAKNLPTETEMPFLALQETKKRRTLEAAQEEDDPFSGGIPQDLLKPTLKKRKKNTSDEENKKGERTSLRFDTDESDWKKKDGKNLRKSMTAKPSVGSWLLSMNDNDTKESSFGNRNKAEKNQNKEKSPKGSPKEEWQVSSNLNIDRIFEKKKAEENSAKVRSMILNYARSGTLGDDSFEVQAGNNENENDKDDESNKSYSSVDSREKGRWSPKFDDDDDDNSRSRSFLSKSMTLGEKSSTLFEDEPTFGFRTRVMLREERQNFENERLKERSSENKADKKDNRDNSFDIGIRAREELMKNEGANFGKISNLWAKYTGKTDTKSSVPKEKEQEKEKEEQKVSKSNSEKEEKRTLRSRLEQAQKEKTPKNKDLDKSKELPERRTSARKAAEKKKPKSSSEEFSENDDASDSDDDIVVTKRSKESISKKLINYNKEDNKKTTPAQQAKQVKLETPARKTTSTSELERSEQKTAYSSDIKTPQTKQAFSLSKSSIVGKYLGSASSNTSNRVEEYNPLNENISSMKRKDSLSNKSDAEDSESYSSGLRNNGVRNLSLVSSLEPQSSKRVTRSAKKTSFDEEKEEDLLATKTIKKRTDDNKEDVVVFCGLVGKSFTRAQEFCKKFNMKFLDDELRNLSRADFLVYDGNEVPRNYRVAFTMMRGKPIVNLDWIEESLRNGKVTNYKEHEYCYSPESRNKLLAGLRFYIDKEFEGHSGNMVLKKDLVNLLEQGNGKILDNMRSCDFCVMKKMGKKSSDVPAHVKVITSQWIIDSIIEGKLLATDTVNYSF